MTDLLERGFYTSSFAPLYERAMPFVRVPVENKIVFSGSALLTIFFFDERLYAMSLNPLWISFIASSPT